jgi:hypothetical protein
MYRREREEMCFGGHWAPGAWGLFFGIIFVLAGLALLTKIEVWPLIVIAFGIMIIIGVLARPRR